MTAMFASGPFADRRFRLLWIGRTISDLGSSAFGIALTFAIVADTGSAAALGLVLAVALGSEMLLVMVGGVWADRLARRHVMLVADAIRCVAHTFIGVQLVLGVVDIPSLLVVALISGSASAFYRPASFGLVPATVDPHLLQRANAVISVGTRTALLAGPAVATGLALSIGVGWAIVLDGLTFAVSVITLARLRVAEPVRARRAGFLADVAAGWSTVRGQRWFVSNLVVHGLWNFGRCFFFTVGAAAVITSLGGELSWGLITQGAAVGALLGAVLSLRVQARRPLVVANVCLALGALPLVCIALRLPVLVIAAAAVVMNTVLGLMGTLWLTTIQKRFAEESISKVGAYDFVASIALNPVGMALAVPIASVLGVTATLLTAALLMAVPALGVLALPYVRRLSSAEPEAQLSGAG